MSAGGRPSVRLKKAGAKVPDDREWRIVAAALLVACAELAAARGTPDAVDVIVQEMIDRAVGLPADDNLVDRQDDDNEGKEQGP